MFNSLKFAFVFAILLLGVGVHQLAAEEMSRADIRKYMILLNNNEAHDRIKACVELKKLGPDAKPLLSFLHMALKRENEPSVASLIRETIAAVEGNAVDENDPALVRRKRMKALMSLIKELDDGDALDRRRAIVKIANFKAMGVNAIPKLMSVAESDPDDLNRQLAQRTITSIESAARLERVKKEDAKATTQPASKVEKNPDIAASEVYLIKQLEIYIKDKQPEVRIRAAKSLGDMGEKAWGTQRLLQQVALNDENSKVRNAAGEALRKILNSRKDPQAAMSKEASKLTKEADFHIQGLLSPLPLTRRESAEKLATLGRYAERAIPMLQKLINDPYERLVIQKACEKAIRAIRADVKKHQTDTP